MENSQNAVKIEPNTVIEITLQRKILGGIFSSIDIDSDVEKRLKTIKKKETQNKKDSTKDSNTYNYEEEFYC